MSQTSTTDSSTGKYCITWEGKEPIWIHDIRVIKCVSIETIDYCNRKCPWCPNKDREQSPDRKMSVTTFYEIIKNLKDINYHDDFHLYFRNEPLCDPILEFHARTLRKNFPTSFIRINTNGDFLKNPGHLMKAGINKIVVNRYDDPTFDKSDFCNRAGDVSEEYVPKKRTRMCYDLFGTLRFLWDGRMVLCCSDFNEKVVIGDVNKTPLVDIWNSPLFYHYREMHSQKKGAELPLCQTCNVILH